jgi:CheY-like chemotaxis protein
LSQVYGFARQSGGTATIESAPGRGTTVAIFLPATTADEAAAVVSAATADRAPERFGARIMVVEDNDDVREYLASVLTQVGFQVVEAGDGAQALAMLVGGGPVDVLCTDIVMPGGLDGYDVAREARAIQPDLKIIFMSGYTDKAAAPANGNSPFLAKPLRGAELVETVRAVIGQ